jgi:hypothetical protein
MKDKQFREPYKSTTETLKATIATQKESIALLTTQLHNERLKNANLDKLARARTNSSKKTVED